MHRDSQEFSCVEFDSQPGFILWEHHSNFGGAHIAIAGALVKIVDGMPHALTVSHVM